MRVITFGTFDVFHYGYLRLLESAKALGEYLIVGASTDDLSFLKKGRYPIYSQTERSSIVKALAVVNEVFYEESLEKKGEYIKRDKADILVMGDDWEGKFDEFAEICKVVYLPRTPSISTTEIIEKIKL